MIIIASIVLIFNVFIALATFPKVFTGKTISDRVSNCIVCLGSILSCILSIYFFAV